MARRLLVLGAGGHGKVVADCAAAMAKWTELAFYDARWPDLQSCGKWSVVGGDTSLLAACATEAQVFVAVGHAATRLDWLHRLAEAGADIASVVHPSAVISEGATLASG